MATLQSLVERSRPAWRPLALAVALGLLSVMLAEGVLHRFELFASDLLFRLRGPLQAPTEVVMVAIDDASFAHNDLQWPWPRDYLAQMVSTISAAGPSVIAIDVQLYEPSTPEQDAELARAIGQAGNVVLVSDIAVERGQGLTLRQLNQPIPALQEAAAAVGLTQFQRDDDGALRRLLAFARHNGELYLSLALQAARLHLGAEDVYAASPGAVWIGQHRVRLEGQYLLVDFRGPPQVTIPTYSAYQVADGLVNPSAFAGKIVIVGATAETVPMYDSYSTPFGSSPPMAGAEVNAHAIDAVLNGRYLRPAAVPVRVGVPPLLAVLTALALRRLRPLSGLLGTLLLLLAYAVTAYALFAGARVVLPLVAPGLAVALTFVGGTSAQFYEERRQRVRVRSLFERYVSPAAIDEMLGQPASVTVGGQRREVTVLFSDIRGFTALSERLHPEQVVEILNEYLGAMTDIIFKHQGTIDKFQGDGILAIWNAPLPVPDHARRAVECAAEMTRALADMQANWLATGQDALHSGIGINTGVCFVGNIGSAKRLDYTVIGDVVNLAARLEGLTKDLGLQIIFTESTRQQLGESLPTQFVTSAQVSGREPPVRIYTLADGAGEQPTRG